MADENVESTEAELEETADEAPAEEAGEDALSAETEVEPVEAAAETAEASVEPAAEPAEAAAEVAAESEPEPGVEPEPSAEPEPAAAEAEVEEPAEEAEGEPSEEAAAPAAEEAAAAAPAVAKTKRKRLPRALRRQRPKPKREQPAERKPITRLPKPEHPRGRRQERQGRVVSAAADKTIVVRVDTVKVHPTYKKVIRRSTKLHAHDEENAAKVGDVVRIVETRPLSRRKRWRLQTIVEEAK